LQPDSLIPDLTNPQAWNRYSYAGNRPVNFNDLTGHCPEEMAECRKILSDLLSQPSASSDKLPKKDKDENCKGLKCLRGSDSNDIALPALISLSSTFNAAINVLRPSSVKLPPSPFACEWFDCALSVASVLFSVGTFPGVPPEIAIPSFIADVAVTVLAYADTEDAYSHGAISNVNRWALNGTGILGVIPGPTGLGLSVINMLFTFTGLPH
jgi:hypothetical protein